MIRWLKAIAQALGPVRKPPRTPDDLWDDEVPISPEHPLVPAPIRCDVMELWDFDCHLHRVQTCDGIEWWLFDGDGELMEAFWIE